jgi:predicted nucleic acid-binding protein
MKYVLDSSVSLKWVLPEPDSAKALRLRDRFHNGDLDLLAPDIFPLENLHTLTKAERQGRIPAGDGWALWMTVMADCPLLQPHPPLFQRAYDIASAARIGIHDCLYIALAEREGCEMVTADDRLLKNLQATFPFIVSLGSIP